jgi:hypothetical protein
MKILKHGTRSGNQAFVRFRDTDMAQAALDGLHLKVTVPGSREPVIAMWARPKPRPTYAKGGVSEQERPDSKLYIGSLERTTTEEDVLALVAPFGQVFSLSLPLSYLRVIVKRDKSSLTGS